VGELDTKPAGGSLRTPVDTFKGHPGRGEGLAGRAEPVSVTISSRNDQLAHLLENTNQTAGLLAQSQRGDIRLDPVRRHEAADELHARRTRQRLLDGTRPVSHQLRGLNQRQTKTTSAGRWTSWISSRHVAAHEDDWSRASQAGPFATVFTNALGNGVGSTASSMA